MWRNEQHRHLESDDRRLGGLGAGLLRPVGLRRQPGRGVDQLRHRPGHRRRRRHHEGYRSSDSASSRSRTRPSEPRCWAMHVRYLGVRGAADRADARDHRAPTPTIVERMPDTRALPHHETAWLGKPQPDDADVPTLVLLHGYGSNEHLIALVPAIRMFLPGSTPGSSRSGLVSRARPTGWIFLVSRRRHRATQHRGDRRDRRPGGRRHPSVRAAGNRSRLLPGHVHGDHGAPPASGAGHRAGRAQRVHVRRRPPRGQPAGGQRRDRYGVPAFVGYDPADPLIPPIANRWAMTFLRTHTDLEEHSYPGMGHSVSMPEIADLTQVPAADTAGDRLSAGQSHATAAAGARQPTGGAAGIDRAHSRQQRPGCDTFLAILAHTSSGSRAFDSLRGDQRGPCTRSKSGHILCVVVDY